MAGKKSAAERRNPLTPPDESLVSVWHEVITQIADPERLEEKEPKKRKREWEKTHPPRCYRGVPADIRENIKRLASELRVSTDEVVRVFLEYGLTCIERGTLTISGVPSQRRVRMTLYPFTGAGWAENGWAPKPPKRGQRSAKGASLWREVAYYRIPSDLHEKVKKLAGNTYPLGEIVTILLKHGLESYNQGVLVLMPQPRMNINASWLGEKNDQV